MEVAACVVLCAEIARAVESKPRLRRRSQVGRPANQPGQTLGQRIEHLTRGVATRHALGIGRKTRQVFVPASGEFAVLHLVEMVGEFWVGLSILLELCHPLPAQAFAALPDARAKVFPNSLGHQELGVLGPVVISLSQSDLLFPKWFAMRPVRILFVRGAIS